MALVWLSVASGQDWEYLKHLKGTKTSNRRLWAICVLLEAGGTLKAMSDGTRCPCISN